MTLSEYIIAFRTEKNISQRKFAENCELSNGYISMLEKGKNPNTDLPITPTLPQLKKLAKGMGVSVNELFTLVDDIDISLDTYETPNGIISENDIKVALFGGDDKNADKKFADVKKYIEFLNSKED